MRPVRLSKALSHFKIVRHVTHGAHSTKQNSSNDGNETQSTEKQSPPILALNLRASDHSFKHHILSLYA